jgi:biopolymer transport protein ExbD
VILLLAVSAGATPSADAVDACVAAWGAVTERADPSTAIAQVRAACAPLVEAPACREALASPGSPALDGPLGPEATGACLATLPPDLRARLEQGPLRPEDLEGRPASDLGAVVAAMFLMIEGPPVSVRLPAAPAAPEHHLRLAVSADTVTVHADGEVVPCSPCTDQALGAALGAVGARPGWAGVDAVTISADASVRYARVLEVMEVARSRFPELTFSVAPASP